MNDYKNKKISSAWTNFYAISIYIFTLIVPFLFILEVSRQFKEFKFLSLLIVTLFTIFILYAFTLGINLCKANVKENSIVLKKLFRGSKEFSFDKIGPITSFNYKRMKFNKVKMKSQDNTEETFVILNNHTIFASEKIDAEIILHNLKRLK